MGEAREVVQGKYAATNDQNPERMRSYYSPQVVKEVPGGLLRGSDAIVAFVATFWEAFPNLKLTITNVVEEGSEVAIRVRMTGTHLGTLHSPGGDIPATGREVDLSFSDDFEVVGGLIVSSHLYLDRLALLEQLGVMPAPAAA